MNRCVEASKMTSLLSHVTHPDGLGSDARLPTLIHRVTCEYIGTMVSKCLFLYTYKVSKV